MYGNAFAADNPSAPDPFAQAFAELDSVLGELRGNRTPGAEPRDPIENANASGQAAKTSPADFGSTPPMDALTGYSPNQDIEPIGVLKPMEREPAAALVGVNSATAGTLPYMIAGAKRLTGYDEGKDFDTLRREEQNRVEGARNSLGEPASRVVEALAPLPGAGALMRGVRTPAQAAKRIGVAGGIYGGVRGYADPVEPGSLDVSERLAPALMNSAIGAATGYAGGRAGGEVLKRVGRRGRSSEGPVARMPPRGPDDTPPSLTTVDEAPALARPVPDERPMPRDLTPTQRTIAISRGREFTTAPEGGLTANRSHPERAQDITRMFADGHDLSTIGKEIGMSAEQVAKFVQRLPATYGGSGIRNPVPKAMMTAMEKEAQDVLDDVAVFRRAEALNAVKQEKAGTAPAPETPPAPAPAAPAAPKAPAATVAKPAAKPAPAAPETPADAAPAAAKSAAPKKPAPAADEDPWTPRVDRMGEAQRQAAEDAFVADYQNKNGGRTPKEVTAKDLVYGDTIAGEKPAKPAPKAEPEPAPKPAAQPAPKAAAPKAEPKPQAPPEAPPEPTKKPRGLTGTQPARSPREPSERQLAKDAERVAKMKPAERTAAENEWRQYLISTGKTPPKTISDTDILRGAAIVFNRSQREGTKRGRQ